MSTVAIPAWTAVGLLPPIDDADPTGAQRSPYRVSLRDLAMRLATTPERRAILLGLLRYRAALHRLGLAVGFQWLDGSFVEDVETIEGRAPRDIDVVTFLRSPQPLTFAGPDYRALDHHVAKTEFRVDSYLVELDLLPADHLVQQAAYWSSVWSHRRDHTWKGFLQLELAPTEDADAWAWLTQAAPPEVGP